jgi:hypothetical protein
MISKKPPQKTAKSSCNTGNAGKRSVQNLLSLQLLCKNRNLTDLSYTHVKFDLCS